MAGQVWKFNQFHILEFFWPLGDNSRISAERFSDFLDGQKNRGKFLLFPTWETLPGILESRGDSIRDTCLLISVVSITELLSQDT